MLINPNYKYNKSWLNRYLIVNLLIALIISLRYFGPHPYPQDTISFLFIVSYGIAQLGLLALLLLVGLRIFARLIKVGWVFRAIAITLIALALSLLLADTFVYQQYRFHFNTIVFELMIEGGTEIFSFSWQLWAMIISIILAFFATQIFISEYIRFKYKEKFYSLKPMVKIWFVLLLCGHGIHTWADAMFKKQITQQARYLPLSFPLTAKSLMAKFGVVNIEAQKQQALLKQKKVKSSINYPLQALQCSAPEQQKNVMIIVFDSWRADMMDKDLTPNIYNLAENSTRFDQHFSGSNNTRHGMFSLFYGIPGHYWQTILDQQRSPVMMEVLKQQEYQMGIFSSAKLTSPEFDQTIFANVDGLRTHSVGDKPYERDIDLTKDFINWHQQKSNDKPFFSFMLFDAAHGFSIPDDFERKYKPSLDDINYMALNNDYDATPFLNLYRNAIYFMDQQVAKVIAQLGDEINNTIIIITGDHGKEFNDSGKNYWGHNSNYSTYQTQVPMIIHWPEQEKAMYQGETSHYDIPPTIMSAALGCNNDTADYSSGQSLFEKQKHDWILLGRDGYYAIKEADRLNELDRVGNFTIYDNQYQEQSDAKLRMPVILNAMEELRRFNN